MSLSCVRTYACVFLLWRLISQCSVSPVLTVETVRLMALFPEAPRCGEQEQKPPLPLIPCLSFLGPLHFPFVFVHGPRLWVRSRDLGCCFLSASTLGPRYLGPQSQVCSLATTHLHPCTRSRGTSVTVHRHEHSGDGERGASPACMFLAGVLFQLSYREQVSFSQMVVATFFCFVPFGWFCCLKRPPSAVSCSRAPEGRGVASGESDRCMTSFIQA